MSNLSAISAKHPLLLIGCGKMGSAMLSGWLKEGLDKDAVIIVDPYLAQIKENFSQLAAKNLLDTIDDLPRGIAPSFVIMAVKPQMMDEALNTLKPSDLSETVVLSVAAGKTIHYFEDQLGQDQAIVRAMPNTPAAIAKGITVCVANINVTDNQKQISKTLLETVSVVEWIDDEALMDAVTALSGSGPAYVFYMAEVMAAAGEALGLPKELSEKLARHTLSGAGVLLEESDESFSKLRENVTSPGGTTAAALDVLMSNEGIAKAIRRAMQEAKARSKELAG
jgi:pyrroline-5-carboxylate reductase